MKREVQIQSGFFKDRTENTAGRKLLNKQNKKFPLMERCKFLDSKSTWNNQLDHTTSLKLQ